jgi:signal transduction histidine kinase
MPWTLTCRYRAGMRRAPPWLIDVAIAAGLLVLILIAMQVIREPGGRPPDALAYALAVANAGVLLLRRRAPVTVLVTACALAMVYHALNYPPFRPAVVIAVPLYTVAAAGHMRAAWAVVLGLSAGEYVGRGFLDTSTEELLPLLNDVLRDVALLAVVVLLGETVRSRRERVQRAEEEREREAQRRVAEERLRLARELHDVMAHTVAVIAVQAGVAADVLDDAPEEARAALGTIRAASKDAMAELRATVGVLRQGEDGAPRAPSQGLGQLDELLAAAESGGVRVKLTVGGDQRPLPPAVDLAAYRILQESLTNVLRHAEASEVTLYLRYEADALVIGVVDDGRGGSPPEDGHGLAGMRERAEAVGGRFRAGPRTEGGFQVYARLPVAEAAT